VLHQPAADRLAEVNERIIAMRSELTAVKAQARDLPTIERDVERLRQHVDASHRLPQHQEWGPFIRELTAFGEETSLSKFTVQPGVLRKQDVLSEMPVAVNFEGDYVSACSFLRRVEEMTRLTSTNGLTVHVVDSTVGRVEVQLSMNLYFADGF
jgi:Tfp pilus assembly protein PilO